MGSGPRSRRNDDPAGNRRPEGQDDQGPQIDSLGSRLRHAGSHWGAFTLSAGEIDSTNSLAAALARKGAPHGSLFLARAQTAGRGRWGRKWESAEGGLYLSFLIRPQESEPRLRVLPLLASVAAAEGLFHSTSVEVALRWPNDLYAAGRKLGGILCESSFLGSRCEFVVVGIGVNVNQSAADFSWEVSSRATSLRVLLGRFVDPTEVALAIAVSLERWWERESSRRVLERWRELASDPEGARVRVVSAEGNAYDASIVGLAEDGGLEVRLEDGARRVLHSDDVHLQEEDGSYYMEVEAHFVARRGSPLFITPSEWDLVWRWEQLGIPLSVVKEGIDRVFERPRALLKRRRLGYCRQTVEAAFRRFREARVGERYGAYEENASEGSGRARIEEIASRLRQVAADCSSPAVARAADEVESLSGRADGSPGEVEEALAAIDRELVLHCETLLDDAPREELRRDAERTLESYRERMPEKVYQAAVASAFRKRLRKKLGLPTLSLYA